ncbi:kinase-like protein [Trichodelitschia bisporula]|uniref:EKC/KEOPS complex subunit BUD32 n=1 Tax=Trichodelitschia bisporula TaxID=703511 RepID=A0A6G1HPE4_9PEZI|nr:kinase-like protein [Trichodelitschia bisporula]
MASTAPAFVHTLPAPFAPVPLADADSLPPHPVPELITQGAEALVYRTHFLTTSTLCALKYRPKKSYRHPTLDARLTKGRILAEARVLVRCRKEGLAVPAVMGADWEAGWLATEWIDGQTIRAYLDDYLHGIDDANVVAEQQEELMELMARVGESVGKMHEIGIVHGDLTTSNLMLRPKNKSGRESSAYTNRDLEGDVVIIDFGLAVQSIQDEDKAVDLYVLERAFGSTHPQAENLFPEVLRAYGESHKGAKVVLKRLEDVRLRGRKKSMLG